MDPLTLNDPEEALTGRVVAAVADRAHAADQGVASEELLVGVAGYLHAYCSPRSSTQPYANNACEHETSRSLLLWVNNLDFNIPHSAIACFWVGLYCFVEGLALKSHLR